MIKAVIFDMDGVLVDSEKHDANLEIAVLREFGVAVTSEQMREYVGTNVRDFVKQVAKDFDVDLPVGEVIKKLDQEREIYYGEIFPLVPHVKGVLESLSQKYLLGLSTSTSKKHAESILGRFGILNLLRARTFGDEVERGKPDPEIYVRTADKLSGLAGENLNMSECVVVEDSRNGMHGVKAAGMKLIARRAGHNMHVDFSLADAVIDDMLEIEGVLQNF
jgi:HAD superfamily hydrolase (TIGR01509 family)